MQFYMQFVMIFDRQGGMQFDMQIFLQVDSFLIYNLHW